MRNASDTLYVLYGSQTGNAEDLAERIARDAKRFHFRSRAVPMDEFPVKLLPQQAFIVFVCSTTGQGEEPENMKKFWRFLLRKDLPSHSLSNLHYGVLGLGDSSYPKFNFAAKKLHRRLLQLGATALMNPTLGDDQHDLGPDAAIEPWLAEFWPKVLKLFPLLEGQQPLSPDILQPPKFNVQILAASQDYDHSVNNLTEVQMIGNKRVTAVTHFQDVRLLTFDVASEGFTYKPGDVAAVMPENLKENVEKFFDLFHHFDRNALINLEPTDPGTQLPSIVNFPCSLEQLVRKYFDLQCIPRRYFFQLLAKLSTDEMEREKLTEFSSAEGQQQLFDYCNRPRRTLLEVLQDFHKTALQIPISYLFDLIPAIRPRAFSIASSHRANPNQLQLLVAVVKYRTKLFIPRLGLCSSWLSQAEPGSLVPLAVKPGTFSFPKEKNIPVVMVGPGTGCAPFRAYISEAMAEAQDEQRDLYLFFGCRNESKDFFFADEWFPLQKSGKLKLFTAFSRDQEDKIYVQHRIAEQGELLRRVLLEDKGWVFIAGNAKQMPASVLDSLKTVLSPALGETGAQQYLELIEKTRRLQLETWS